MATPLDNTLADAQTQIQAIITSLTAAAAAGTIDASGIQQLQTAATALAADITQAGPQVATLEQQLLACQQQPQPAPTPQANQQLMVDAKVAALVALGALALGGVGGYLIKGSGILGESGRKRHNPLKAREARRLRLPPHPNPNPRKS